MTTGKTALITGASSGIGLELARLFAAEGHDLVLVARNAARMTALADELEAKHGVSVIVIAKDLTVQGAANEIMAELANRELLVDSLVNCAGFNVYGRFDLTDARSELDMLQVNIIALTQLTKLLLPGMMRRGSGRILNVGSTGSFAPGPFDAVYCASKAYVLSFSEALATELEGTGVTVTVLCPGATRTRFAERAQMTGTAMFRGRTADPASVARTGYRAMKAGKRVVIPGVANALMTFSIRLSPRGLVAAISKRMLARVEVAV